MIRDCAKLQRRLARRNAPQDSCMHRQVSAAAAAMHAPWGRAASQSPSAGRTAHTCSSRQRASGGMHDKQVLPHPPVTAHLMMTGIARLKSFSTSNTSNTSTHQVVSCSGKPGGCPRHPSSRTSAARCPVACRRAAAACATAAPLMLQPTRRYGPWGCTACTAAT